MDKQNLFAGPVSSAEFRRRTLAALGGGLSGAAKPQQFVKPEVRAAFEQPASPQREVAALTTEQMLARGVPLKNANPVDVVNLFTELPTYRLVDDDVVNVWEHGHLHMDILSSLAFSTWITRLGDAELGQLVDHPAALKARRKLDDVMDKLWLMNHERRDGFLRSTADFSLICKLWRRTKQVYRVNGRLLATLAAGADQPLAGDVFANLPFTELFLDLTDADLCMDPEGTAEGRRVTCAGVVVYKTVFRNQPYHLVHIAAVADDLVVTNQRYMFVCGDRTLPEDAELRRWMVRRRDLGEVKVTDDAPTEPAEELFANLDFEDAVFNRLLAAVVYIASHNADVRRGAPVASQGKGRRRRGAPTQRAQGWDVGFVVGAAIERRLTASRESGGASREPGASRRPHVRRAHWHHFWTGPRDSVDRKLTVKWVDNVFVNCDDGEQLPVTEHRSRRG